MATIDITADDIKKLIPPNIAAPGPTAPPPPDPSIPPNIAPPPPQQTPAVAGWGAWASDPLNQQKVSSSMTPPNQPINPPAPPPAVYAPPPPPPQQMASANPPQVQPSAAMAPPIPTQSEYFAANPSQQAKPNWTHQAGSGWKGVFKDIGGIGVAGALGAAGGMHGDPAAGVNWVGQQQDLDRAIPELNAKRYQSAVIQPAKDVASLADTQSQTAQRTAAANRTDTQADSIAPFTMTQAQAAAIGHPELAGSQTTMRDYNKTLQGADKNTATVTTGAGHDTARVTATTATDATRKSIAEAADKTRKLIAQMHDSTSRSNNAATNAAKGGGQPLPGGGFKVPADVTKRAALASNVNENATAASAIIQQRPDIVGAAGGRYTNVQQMIGSDDPAISELGVRMHNIALASNGAHGVRAAGAIEKTENELFNQFKSGPKAIGGALKATTDSMQTFLNDESNFSTTGKRNAMQPPTNGAPNSGKADYVYVAGKGLVKQ